jgi:hypothetical protein
MLLNVILSDGPTLWMLCVASCDGRQKVQENEPSFFALLSNGRSSLRMSMR